MALAPQWVNGGWSVSLTFGAALAILPGNVKAGGHIGEVESSQEHMVALVSFKLSLIDDRAIPVVQNFSVDGCVIFGGDTSVV